MLFQALLMTFATFVGFGVIQEIDKGCDRTAMVGVVLLMVLHYASVMFQVTAQ